MVDQCNLLQTIGIVFFLHIFNMYFMHIFSTHTEQKTAAPARAASRCRGTLAKRRPIHRPGARAADHRRRYRRSAPRAPGRRTGTPPPLQRCVCGRRSRVSPAGKWAGAAFLQNALFIYNLSRNLTHGAATSHGKADRAVATTGE